MGRGFVAGVLIRVLRDAMPMRVNAARPGTLVVERPGRRGLTQCRHVGGQQLSVLCIDRREGRREGRRQENRTRTFSNGPPPLGRSARVLGRNR